MPEFPAYANATSYASSDTFIALVSAVTNEVTSTVLFGKIPDPVNITDNSANALTVGRQGTTYPAFNVDAATASSATGVEITAAAAASGVALAAISSGTNEDLTIDAKGTGDLILQNTSTGKVAIGTDSPGGLLDVRTGVIVGSHAGVTHGRTFLTPTNNYMQLGPLSGTAGGVLMYGISDTDATGFQLSGIIGATNPTDTTPAIKFQCSKSDGGTSVQALSDAETIFQVFNYTSPLATFLGSGKFGVLTTTPEFAIHASTVSAQLGLDSFTTTANNSSEIYIRKSNDASIGTLTATDDGDTLGKFFVQGVNSSSAYGWGASIEVLQNGAVGATYIPTDIIFKAGTNAAIAETVAMVSGGGIRHTERSSDPANPAEGKCVIWLSNGDGLGDDGDLMIKGTAGGVTKYATLFDHSAGS